MGHTPNLYSTSDVFIGDDNTQEIAVEEGGWSEMEIQMITAEKFKQL